MRIDLMRDKKNIFPLLEAPDALHHLRVWNCKYKTLQPISRCKNLEELVVASVPDDNLDFLSELTHLRYLRILHMPKINDITPLQALQSLESLSLATLPDWDSKGKLTIVDSLEPLRNLLSLKHLELFGICPSNKSLKSIELIDSLKTARFSGFPKDEVERFYDSTNVENKFIPESTFR